VAFGTKTTSPTGNVDVLGGGCVGIVEEVAVGPAEEFVGVVFDDGLEVEAEGVYGGGVDPE